MLCHKPAQLDEVAREVAGRARVVASVLAGVTLADLRAAYGDTPVFRLMPNTPVEVRQGVIVLADATPTPTRRCEPRSSRCSSASVPSSTSRKSSWTWRWR